MKKFGMVLASIVLVIGAFFGGIFLGKSVFKPKGSENNVTVTNKVININLDEVVTELVNESEVLNGKNCMFRLPKVTLENSDYAEKINEEIDELKKKAETARENILKNNQNTLDDDIHWVNCDFSYFEENGVLTIIVTRGIGGGEDAFKGKYAKVYNIDLATGNEVTVDELFSKAGLNKDEFTSKITEYAKNYIDPTGGSKEISYIRGNALKIENCEFYVKDGKLIALVEAEGTDYGATYIIDMTTGELVD